MLPQVSRAVGRLRVPLLLQAEPELSPERLALPCPVIAAMHCEQLQPALVLCEEKPSHNTSGEPWQPVLLQGAVYFILLKKAWLLKALGQASPQEKPQQQIGATGLHVRRKQ